MTKEQLVKELQDIALRNHDDCEINHGRAEDLLIEFINDPEVKTAYDSITKWYA